MEDAPWLGTLMYITCACFTGAPVTLLTTEPSSKPAEDGAPTCANVDTKVLQTIKVETRNREREQDTAGNPSRIITWMMFENGFAPGHVPGMRVPFHYGPKIRTDLVVYFLLRKDS